MIQHNNVKGGSQSYIRIHNYLIGQQIGKGSFASIRIAYQMNNKNPLAIKILSKKQLLECSKGETIVFNETILAPLLDHPNIIEIFEIAESSGQIFQVMRYAENGDMLQYLRKKPITLEYAVIVMDQLLSAVEYLHSLGICNRDIKLENILITKQGNIKLCDFGIAAFQGDLLLNNNCGSFEYSAPEAINSKAYCGFKADMWSVGVVFYSLFTRKLPFSNVDRGFDYSVPIDYSTIPNDFKPLIQSLLSIDPNNRPLATDARSYPAIRNSTHEKKPPLSALFFDSQILISQTKVLTKLSQVLNVPYTDLANRLKSESLKKERLLFQLFNGRMEKDTQTSMFPFRRNIHIASGPQRPMISNKHDFPTHSCAILGAIKKFVIPQKGTISSAITLEPIIVFHEGDNEHEIIYDCFDNGSNSSLVLFADEISEPLSHRIFDHLASQFHK